MGLEDRDWFQEARAEQDGKQWKRPGRFTAPKPEVSTEPVQHNPQPPKPRTPPSYVHLQAQEILEARKSKSGPPFSLALLLFAFLSVGIGALYLYF